MINRIIQGNVTLLAAELVLMISFWILWFATRNTGFLLIGILTVVFTVLTLSFLRDPDRRVPDETGVVLSPADGKIVGIIRHKEKVKDPEHTLAIYLRLWDVHINRIPVSGTIETRRYQHGKFRPAFFHKAASNEQMVLVITDAEDRFVLKQIAGILARRIVCWVMPGNRVKQGDRFGLIILGSRVELTIPARYKIAVRINQKVKAGETIVARL
jgi:phosphatidylserine decarboxylase